jgi:hypothetical protein
MATCGVTCQQKLFGPRYAALIRDAAAPYLPLSLHGKGAYEPPQPFGLDCTALARPRLEAPVARTTANERRDPATAATLVRCADRAPAGVKPDHADGYGCADRLR